MVSGRLRNTPIYLVFSVNPLFSIFQLEAMNKFTFFFIKMKLSAIPKEIKSGFSKFDFRKEK